MSVEHLPQIMSSGVTIHSLPFEIITLIIARYREPSSPQSRRPTDIRDLSLVCKMFNEACSTFLFRFHVLFLRCQHFLFNIDRARERISVISRKAPYIKTLWIKDWCWKDDDLEAFPDEIIPDLITALRSTTRITELLIDNRKGFHKERSVPVQLWSWISDQGSRLKVLRLMGTWSPPARATIIENVQKLHIEPFDERMNRLVEVSILP